MEKSKSAKRPLLLLLFLIATLFLAGCGSTVEVNSSFEGYLQIQRKTPLETVEAYLGEPTEIKDVSELMVTTNKTKERRTYIDKEQPAISYYIELDDKERVITYKFSSKDFNLPILEEKSKDFDFAVIKEMCFPNEEANVVTPGESEYYLAGASGLSMREIQNKFGPGIESRSIDYRLYYFKDNTQYLLFFNKNNMLTQIDVYYGQ